MFMMTRAFTMLGFAITFIFIVGLLFSLPVMLLWNWCLVPAVPALVEIGWLQAWGISILFSLLTNSGKVHFKS